MNPELIIAKGSQIYLRPVSPEDIPLTHKWRNSDIVMNNFIYRKPISLEDQKKWYSEKVFTGQIKQFIICNINDDKPLGAIYLENFESAHKRAEEGIFLGESEAFGHGIGKEAASLLIAYSFKELGLHKLTARVLAYNTASIRMHESAGYKQEALLKEEVLINGKYEDIILFGIINPHSSVSV